MSTDDMSIAELARVLDEAEPLLGGGRRGAAAHPRTRLLENRFRVLVVGEAKRGKSTLVNALIGRKILPTVVASQPGRVP